MDSLRDNLDTKIVAEFDRGRYKEVELEIQKIVKEKDEEIKKLCGDHFNV